MKNLGIISGMGAFAGIRLANFLLDQAQDSKIMQDSDFPEFLLYNLPVKGMDETGIVDEGLVKSQLKKAISKMEVWECKQIIIACNSAHVFLDELQTYFDGQIINMIDAACQSATADKVGVLCSDSTKKSKLYERHLRSLGIEPISTTDAEQAALNQAVKAAISGRSIRGNLTDTESIIIRMSRSGADQIIIGCTEIPLILESRMAMTLIDAGQEAIKEAMKNG
jgi:aspartate racemase